MQWQFLVAIFLAGLCFVATSHDSECTPPHSFKCHNSSKCISHIFVCDGEGDCDDGSDEDQEKCHKQLPSFTEACRDHEIQCRDRFHCIPEDDFCDGKKDCIDGSDEPDDCRQNITCHGYKCASGECILQTWACDGRQDCRDGSDESDCGSVKNSSIPPANCNNTIDKYLCANNRCIDLSLVCDNMDNCGDDSDENPSNCKHAEEACKSSPCSSKCRPTPKGYQCACNRGYILKKQTCEDTNECEQWGLCDQTCINTVGSYYCTCGIGYKLLNDQHSCKSENGEALLIFATKTSIRGYYLESETYYSIAENLQHVVGVSLDANYVYWSDIQHGEETIFRSLDDGSKREVIVTAGLGCPEDIAVDWITGNIYFTDSMYKHIGVCNDNGTFCRVLINEDTDKPRGIVVAPARGQMYWSDWGINPHIAVSFMDGSKRDYFVKNKLGWPNGLTIDYPSERLYWVDAKLRVIESIHLDGVDRRTVLHDVAKHPYSIAIFGNRLYWSDWSTKSIHSCDKFTGKNYTTLVQKNETLYGIHIYHSTYNLKYANPCIYKQCSQLCLLAENHTYTCACTMDKELGMDHHTCKNSAKRKHLAIAAGSTIVNYYHELIGRPKVTSSVTAHHINAITYDPLKDTLIAADDMSHSIFRYYLKSYQVNHIMPIANEVIESIAFDYLGNNLYKSNAMFKKIEVQSLNTGEKTEFSYSESPFDVLVVPEEGMMFVVFRSYDSFHIDRAQMNGLGSRVHLIEQGLFGPKISLTYDVDTKRIFWADEGTGRIESMDTQGQNRRLFRTGITSPVSIAVLDTEIFWTSRRSARLSWTDKKQIAPGIKGINIGIDPSVNIPLLQSIDGLYTGPLHPCGQNNGDCSHICLVAGAKNRLCACPSNFVVNSDMKSCKLKTSCASNETKCTNSGKCISNVQKCNGVHDCPDGEDEYNCPTVESSCLSDEFACRNGECIKKIERCDSVFHCHDHSDEEDCRNTCTSEQHRCRDGTCISSSLVCNGQNDCDDFSDEEDCADHVCEDHTFKCANGYCIPRNWECDGQADCTDGSDEHESCNPDDCADGMFSCHNGRCIDVLLKCNGMDNCEDNSDEEDCTVDALICTHEQYRCKQSTKCIHMNLKCDGKGDCPLQDDEQGCGRCLSTQFSCANGRCIPSEWTCDHADDCGDNSDERNCDKDEHYEHGDIQPSTINCTEEQFACKSGHCVSLDKACDGEENCLDASDEGGSCGSACLKDICENVCHSTPNGPVCSCREGYQIASNKRSCNDVDECVLGVCPQHCTNRPGTFACSCYEGYQLRLNKVSCKAIGPAMKLVTATSDDIRIVIPQLERGPLKVLFHDPDIEINGLDTNARDETVYWSNEALGIVNKISMGKNRTRVAASDSLGRPQVVVVDWITGNVYVFDARFPSSIKTCYIETNKCSTIVHFDLSSSKVTAMAIQPIVEILFFAQARWQMNNAPSGEIIRTNLMGGDEKTIVDKAIGIVSGIAIDHHRALIYWADHYHAMIECVDFDGQYRKVIVKDIMAKPVGLYIFEDTLYWKSEGRQVLNKRLLYGDVTYSVLPIGNNNINRLFVITQISRQPASMNLCENHTCSHICVIHKGRPICLCRDGLPATLNNNTACSNESIDLIGRHSIGNDLGHDNSPIVAANSTDDDNTGDGSLWIGLTCGLLAFVSFSAIYYYVKTKRPDLMMHRPNLKNPFDGIRFVKRRSNNNASTTSNSTLTLMPGQHEYANPIPDISNTRSNGSEMGQKKNLPQPCEVDEVSGDEMDEIPNTNMRSRLIE